jgi:hypothetical protein
MRRLAVAMGLCGSLVIGLPAQVLAQDRSAVEVAAGGYSFMRDFLVKENFPAGWFASGACNITSWLAAVGEVAGTYKSQNVTLDSVNYRTNTQLHTFLGGPRYSRRMNGVTPFGQVLVGVARETGGMTIFRPSIATAETKLALQPGGGVDIPLTGHLSARLGADYRRIFAKRKNTDQKGNNELRLAAGIVVGFSRR